MGVLIRGIEMFVKNYLIEYKGDYFVLSDDTDYHLTIKRVWLWGLFVTHKKITYTLTPHDNYHKYFELWSGLIETQKAISL